MNLNMLVVAAVLIAAVSASSVPAGFPPAQYTVTGTFSLPYGNITAPLSVIYDASVGTSKSFYNGLDYHIQNLKLAKDFDVSIDNNQPTCTVSVPSTGPALDVAAETLFSAFPDLSKYTSTGTVLCPDSRNNGLECDEWVWFYNVLGKTGTYKFYFVSGTATPYQFSWVGLDLLIGSHFDHYIFRYNQYQPNSVNAQALQPPALCKNAAPATESSGLSLALETMLPNGATQRFTAFADKHGKKYANRAEFLARQRTFHDNEAFIAEHNAKTDVTFTVAMNHLGDLTKEERSQMRGYKPMTEAQKSQLKIPVTDYVMKSTAGNIPTYVDWREQGATSPVKDQGICGSCWAFSTTECLEGQHYLKNKGPLVEFSEQNLMDCSWPQGNDACDGGEQHLAFEYVHQNGGLATEKSYGPYLMQNDYCHYNSSGVVNGVQVETIYQITGETELLDALAHVGPISISIDASLQSFGFYQSGVYYDPACGSAPADLDHAVLAVGYGVDPIGGPYWLVKNSWSIYYGEWGYIKIARKDNDCGVSTSPVYPSIA